MSVADHHSALLPWRRVASEKGAVIKYVQLTPEQEPNMEHFKSLLSSKTAAVCMVHLSNVLGFRLDAAAVAREAHKVSSPACCVPHDLWAGRLLCKGECCRL